jgi:hypothetical protein
MVITVFGAATSPVLATVTVGVPELPGTIVRALVVRLSSRRMPEQVDSATTTVPPATALRPPLRVRSRPRIVQVSRPVSLL